MSLANLGQTREVPAIKKCPTCKKVNRVIATATVVHAGYGRTETRYTNTASECDCGKIVYCVPIKARYSESRKCDPRCTGATGHNCECQCNGVNHGVAA